MELNLETEMELMKGVCQDLDEKIKHVDLYKKERQHYQTAMQNLPFGTPKSFILRMEYLRGINRCKYMQEFLESC